MTANELKKINVVELKMRIGNGQEARKELKRYLVKIHITAYKNQGKNQNGKYVPYLLNIF